MTQVMLQATVDILQCVSILFLALGVIALDRQKKDKDNKQ